MAWMRGAAIVALSLTLFSPRPTFAAEAVGEAVRIKTEVIGAGGALAVSDPVHRDERISTSQGGLGQFLFKDGTKLAVGWGSSVTIDKFVFDDSDSVKKLTIKAAKGTFRWISGSSKSSAYEILTPAGTIGVRGTAFDFYVDPDGTTAVVLLNGAARFCGAGGCRQLTKRCDCVVAKRNGSITDPRRVNRSIFNTLGNPKALPFLSGSQQLSAGFGRFGMGCGLVAAVRDQRDDNKPDATRPANPGRAAPAPSPPAATRDPPSAPAPQAVADTPSPPDTPSIPGTPDKPSKHEGREHHGKHDHDHNDDDDHDDHDHNDHHDHDWGGPGRHAR